MHKNRIRFAQIGVGGFARAHLDAILALEKRGLTSLEAVADPDGELVRATFGDLGRALPATFTDYRAMLGSAKADVAAIATPLHLHCEMAVAALEGGYNVFMEKPPVVSVEQWERVMAAIEKSGKKCAIDFQWLSSKPIADFKRWIVEGKLGAIETVVAYSHQKRYDTYYTRSPWAGKIRLGDRLVRDGSVNNPMAHQLNNALYLATAAAGECAQPTSVRSELYRAHLIETEDTTCTEIFTRAGAKIYFYTTLCSQQHFNHTAWRVTGTKASALFEGKKLQLSRGESVVETLTYSDKQLGSVEDMVENATLFLQGKVHTLLCPFEKTRPFVATVEAMFDSSQQVRAVPAASVRRLPVEDTTATEIVDIDELLQEAAARRVLLSDLKVHWAAATKPVSLLG